MEKAQVKKKNVKKHTSTKQTNKMTMDTMLFDFVKKISVSFDSKEDKKYADRVLKEDIVIVRDIPYSEKKHASEVLDVYYKDGIEGYLPVIIDIHGGGFVSGDKSKDRFFCQKLAQLGFVVFSINYTLATKTVKTFESIQEVHTACKWIYEHAKEYNGKSSEIYLCGHSAGGMLATIEAIMDKSDGLCKVYNTNRNEIGYKGLIINCGYMKFYDKGLAYVIYRRVIFPNGYERDERYKSIVFEKREDLKELPRTLLITNNRDELKSMTLYFHKLLEKTGVECKLERLKTGGHVGILFDPENEMYNEFYAAIKEFFNIKNS